MYSTIQYSVPYLSLRTVSILFLYYTSNRRHNQREIKWETLDSTVRFSQPRYHITQVRSDYA